METGSAIAFWILAAITVGSALGVVLVRNLFRAALLLILSFVGIAGLYITLSADFLAAVQILIYAGAIAILVIFAIMLTSDAASGDPFGRFRVPALLVAGLVVITLAFVILNTDWPQAAEAPFESPTLAIADALFNKFVLPFEVASVLLLAALIGAFVMARER